MTSSVNDPQDVSPGRKLGEFVLLARLGAGGMGAVFRARHEATGAEYALKVFTGTDAEGLMRFQREGQAQAAVDDHPNVVRVHSSGIAGRWAYLVMDLATGGDLQDRLRGGPLEPDVAAQLVRDLARGLAHVHARGVLHRDLKPANVIFDHLGTPKLTDFGLARLSDASRLTATGALMGTPAYMAAEQVNDHRLVDARTDVYGLGAVLYHALTGVPPFAGAVSPALMLRVLNEKPMAVRSIRREVPRALAVVCERAMEKDPQVRTQTAADLADELERYLSGESDPGRRTHWLVGAGVGLALAVTVGAVLVSLEPEQQVAKPPTPDVKPPPVEPPAEPRADPVEPRPEPVEPSDPAASDLPIDRAKVDQVPAPMLYEQARALLEVADLTPQQREAALVYLRSAAKQGFAKAQVHLAREIYNGNVEPKHPQEADGLLLAAMNRPHLSWKETFSIAQTLIRKAPAKLRTEHALPWLRRVVLSASPNAQREQARSNVLMNLAAVALGAGPLEPELLEVLSLPEALRLLDVQKSRPVYRLFHQALLRGEPVGDLGVRHYAQGGMVEAKTDLGTFLLGAEETRAEGLQLLKAAADSGHPTGRFRYAAVLIEGNFVPQDTEQGLRLLRQAADENPWALVHLAELTIDGEAGLEPDAVLGRQLLEQALAKRRILQGLFRLGGLYYRGEGVDQDQRRAVALYREGAERGHVPCLRAMADHHDIRGRAARAANLRRRADAIEARQNARAPRKR